MWRSAFSIAAWPFLLACPDASVAGLDAGAAADGSGAPGGPDVGLADAGMGDGSVPCPEFPTDSDVQLARLGIELSTTVVTGQMGQAETAESDLLIPVDVERVHRGLYTEAGRRLYARLSSDATPPVPGRYVVGFRNASPRYLSEEDPRRVLPGLAFVEPDAVTEAEVGPRPTRNPSARVRIVERVVDGDLDRRRWVFEVVEPLSEDWGPTRRFSTGWTHRRFAAEFPEPSADATYVGAFSPISDIPDLGPVSWPVDLRPDDPDTVRQIRRLLSEGDPFVTSARQAQREAATLRLAWTVRRAPEVHRVRVTGASIECCSGAGGELKSHRSLEVLAGSPRESIVIGGHAHYPPGSCDEERLLAIIPDVDQLTPPNPSFGCGPVPAYDGFGASPHHVLANLDLENESQVREWMGWTLPPTALRPAEVPGPATVPPAPAGPWSEPPGVTVALIRSDRQLVWFEDVRVTERDGWTDVSLSTPFWSFRTGELERVAFSTRCPDPRWVDGARGYASAVIDAIGPFDEPRARRSYLVPGAIYSGELPVPPIEQALHDLVGPLPDDFGR